LIKKRRKNKMAILDLQTIRYINLLDGTAKVKTRRCFTYNNIIFFAVPESLVSKAIGPGAINIKRMHDKLNKKIKIISEPRGVEDLQKFVHDVVEPVQFKQIDVQENNAVLTAGSQSKAALIGRNRRREAELKQIIEDNFGLELKIV
jgi:transcription antitermination factor NusA-like protein